MFAVNISGLIGRLHPVLVHLPIGMLIISCILYWMSKRQRYAVLKPAVHITFLCGFISAIASAISGYFLSRSDDYDEQLVSLHQWMGIILVIASAILYFSIRRNWYASLQTPLMIAVFLLVGVTGHLGGSLTHGTDYFAQAFNDESEEALKPIPNVQEAVAYNDIVQPILKKKCYNCHGKSRQKGGLRMDIPEDMLQGGEDGIVLHPGNAEESELIKRLNLPREHEDHMPPKEKSQLNDHEVALLHWWIESGASFDKKVKELEQPEKVKPLLTALEAPPEQKSTPDIPEAQVEKADQKAIDQLVDRGVVVLPVSQNSNYLMANFVGSRNIKDSDLDLLLPIQKQLVWLKLADAPVSDSAMNKISKCTNLMRLQLNGTRVTDKGIEQLRSLNKLRYLNVVNTKVTADAIIALKGMPLHSLYVYQSGIQESDREKLRQAFPKANIDLGGYEVPTLPSDTSLVKRVVEN